MRPPRQNRDRDRDRNRDRGRPRDTARHPSVEATASSVEEAILKACTQLRVTRDKVRIEVLDEGKPKLLGLFGGRPSRVRATLKNMADAPREIRPERADRMDRPARPERESRPAREQVRSSGDRPERGGRDRSEGRPERGDREARGERGGRDRDRDRGPAREPRADRPERQPRPERTERPESSESDAPIENIPMSERMEKVRSRAEELIRMMGSDTPVTAEDRDGEVWLSVDTSGMDGILIGRRGETLTAFEHLLTRMSSLHERNRVKVVFDVAGYRSRTPAETEADGDEQPDMESSGSRDEMGGRGRRRRGGRSRRPLSADDFDEPPVGGEGAVRAMDSEESEPAKTNGTYSSPTATEETFDDEASLPGPVSFESEGLESYDRPPRRSGSGGGGGRDRDRGGDRGGRRGGGRDRDRGDRGSYPEVEMTPELLEKIKESKRLEQKLIESAAIESPVPDRVENDPNGPKLPSFRRNQLPKRRGYRPPGA
jgi:predicted RNA-binding protein Jag